jgi:hypothetical protein
MDMTVNSFKVGDGAAAWNDIEYAGTDVTLDDYYTKVEADDAFQPKGDYLTDFVEQDPTVPDHVKGITQDDIDGWNAGGSGGTGSSVHIGENPPADPQEGQQWMEVPADGDATMWIYDGGKWLQQPGGKDGAKGADGNIQDGADDGSQDGIIATWSSADDQWQPNTAVTVDASGDATFSGNALFQGGTEKNGIATTTSGTLAEIQMGTTPGNSGLRGLLGFTRDTGIFTYSHESGGTATEHLSIDQFGNATFSGTVSAPNITRNGSPVIDAKGLIKTLSTLRNATKDETTLEGMRDALADAIGGLIENLEHQITTMLGEDSE